MEEKHRFPRPAKVVLIVFGVLVCLAAVAVLGFNVYIRTTYSQFFEQAEEEFPIPGLHEGFVVQDLDNLEVGIPEVNGSWLFSGYDTMEGASPIYRRSPAGEVTKFFVSDPNGEIYKGHGSGITSTSEYVYLTRDAGFLVFAASDIATAQEGEIVQAVGSVDMDFYPAFLNIEGDTLFAGNFHFPEKYETPEEHRIITTDEGENRAVMYAYPASWQRYGFSEQAEYVFSIPSKVQGMCLTPSGKLIFSTSWGLSASHMLAYDMGSLQQDGTFIADGREVPLYILDSRALVDDFTMPPMTEGIEMHDGRIYITDEAASMKYAFGALYGFDDVYSVEL